MGGDGPFPDQMLPDVRLVGALPCGYRIPPFPLPLLDKSVPPPAPDFEGTNSPPTTMLPLDKSAEVTALDDTITRDHELRIPCYCEENSWRLVYRHCNAAAAINANSIHSSEYNYHTVFVSNLPRRCSFYMQRAAAGSGTNEFVNWDYHVFVIRVEAIAAAAAAEEADEKEEELVTTKRGNERRTAVEALDVDTLLLPYPCPLGVYLDGSFPQYSEQYHHRHTTTATNEEMEVYRPYFRVVPAQQYLRYFYSDRMHMYNEDDGQWSAPPPKYLPIMNGLLELDDNNKTGRVLDRNNNKGDNDDDVNIIDQNIKTSGGSNLETYINMFSNNDDDDDRYGKVYNLDQFRAKYC